MVGPPIHDTLQSMCFAPSAVIVPMKQPVTVSGGFGSNCQLTLALLTYQPLLPSVPVTWALTEYDAPPAALGAARHARAVMRSKSQRFAVMALGMTPLLPSPSRESACF